MPKERNNSVELLDIGLSAHLCSVLFQERWKILTRFELNSKHMEKDPTLLTQLQEYIFF